MLGPFCHQAFVQHATVGPDRDAFPEFKSNIVQRKILSGACWAIFPGRFTPLQSFDGISNLSPEQYKRLRAHWDQVLPLQTLDVSYEELIENPNEVTQEILNFCELESPDKCRVLQLRPNSQQFLSYNQPRPLRHFSQKAEYATHLEGYDWHETKPTQAP